MNSFYSREELDEIGLKSFGINVLISKKTSIYSPENITIGDNVRIDDFVILSGNITIGNYVHVAAYSALFGGAGIVMKNYSGLSSRVTIYSVSDDYSGNFMTNPTIPSDFTNVKKGKVVLHEYVIVGATSVILPGVEIGEGTAVGAMSVVTGSLPEWKICKGVPAKVLTYRSKALKELEQKLLESNNDYEELNNV